jgi:hypothetical protein
MVFFDFQSSKSGVIDQIPTIQLRHLSKFNLSFNTIWTDSDTVYQDRRIRDWAVKNGITLQVTAPYRHEGIAESWMRTV